VTLRFPWWVYAALGVVVFIAGWCGHAATTKPADQATIALTDSLRKTREDFDNERARRRTVEDSLLLVHEIQAAADAAARREAGRLRTIASQARAVVGRLDQQLGLARNAADSLPLVMAQNNLLIVALDSTGVALDTLERVTIRMTADQKRLMGVIGSLQVQRTADSTRLVIQDGLLDKYRKAQAPCQKWCPTLVGNYEIRERAVSLGAGLRYKIFTVSATYQVF
jgi:hypothetical protein